MTTTNQSPHEKILWQKWLQDYDHKAANDLIENYLYLVTFHVERIASTVPKSVSKDDLKSFGLLGLFDAMKKFEIERNLKFDTYASFRIRGAIIDGLRKEDWLPRSLRDKTKRVEEAMQKLEQELQRAPLISEIANHLDVPVEDIESTVRDSTYSYVWSLEEKPLGHYEGSREGAGYLVADDEAISPDENLLFGELQEELAESIKRLNENEQLVISLFYHEELTFTEIGKILTLTTSRISQIHKQAIFKLRNSLKKIDFVK